MGDRDVPLFFVMAFKVDGTEVTGLPAGWAAGQDDDPLADQNQYEANVAGAISAFDAVGSGSTAGSGYTNGTYEKVPLAGGSGSGAIAKLVIASGALSGTPTVVNAGNGYADNEELTFDDADVGGGGGSGGKCKVNGVATASSGPTSASTSNPPVYDITRNADGVDGAGGSAGQVLKPLADQSKIAFTIINNGGGGTGADADIDSKATTGGSGDGNLKVDMRRAGKVITKMMVDTKGADYKQGDVITVAKANSGTTNDVTARLADTYTPIGIEIKDNGGMKASLADKTNLGHVASDFVVGTAMKINLFVDDGAGGNPQFIRAAIHTNATGYVAGDEITIAKATAGTDNDVVLVVK